MSDTIKTRMMNETSLTEDDFANHYSDLYIVGTPEAAKWLRNAKISFSWFTSQKDSGWNGAGKLSIEIQFGYMDEYVAAKKFTRKG